MGPSGPWHHCPLPSLVFSYQGVRVSWERADLQAHKEKLNILDRCRFRPVQFQLKLSRLVLTRSISCRKL